MLARGTDRTHIFTWMLVLPARYEPNTYIHLDACAPREVRTEHIYSLGCLCVQPRIQCTLELFLGVKADAA
jgi:hypothetical protein